MPERMRFFSGQFLTAGDFETEQKYFMDMRRLHNRLLHGSGIVEGLQVLADPNQTGSVIVSPGFALDPCGREIIVDSPTRAHVGISKNETCFVTLQYTETPTDPVPVADADSQFRRIREGFSIEITLDDPAEQGNAEALGLARLVEKEGAWIIDETYRPSMVK